MKGYKLCKLCGAPILKKGQVRRNHDSYRRAQGCSYARGCYYRALRPFRDDKP